MASATTPDVVRASPIPVLLLKTKSSPRDVYEELFASSTTGGAEGSGFEAIFVPVLEHCLDDGGVARLRDHLANRQIQNPNRRDNGDEQPYGGMIFTSQRAVEAFAKVVAQGSSIATRRGNVDGDDDTWPHLQNVPIYSVGPATTRGLRAVPQVPPLQVSGDHTGNGEDLAHYIREHYVRATATTATTATTAAAAAATETEKQCTNPPPLLFVVGEKRRDIIPKLLKGDSAAQRIHVDELVVYGTSVMGSFADDLRRTLEETRDRPVRWFVVFSPTGCDTLLAGLGLLDPDTGRARTRISEQDRQNTYIATIGPTTRAHLRDCFGFEPDVCAAEPSPEGVLRGIQGFMAAQALATTAATTTPAEVVDKRQTIS